MRSPLRLCFRTGVIFSLYFSIGRCNYGPRFKCNDVRRRFSALHYYNQSYRATALEDLTLCIQDIMSWIVSNMLKCNPKKTEISQFSSRFSPADSIPSIKVGDCSITPSNEDKDLGVTLDRHLTLKTHINN